MSENRGLKLINNYSLDINLLKQKIFHDIKSPISVLNLASEHLPLEQKELTTRAIDQIMCILMDELSVLKKEISYSHNSVEDTYLQIIKEVVSEKKFEYKEKNVQVVLEALWDLEFEVFRSNSNELKRVLSNLINNAVESYSSEEIYKKVVISTAITKQFIEIYIQDWGRGIDKKIKENIGKLGTSSKNAISAEGKGMGIWMAKNFLKKIGGELLISSQEGWGTEVCLCIPRTCS